VRRCIVLALLVALGLGHAQDAVCLDRLDEAARGAGSQPPRVASALARAAFEALEPAYPQRRGAREWSDANAAWLDRRGWLPDGWNEDELDADAWAALLAELQEPYGVDPRPVSGEADAETLLAEAEAALAAGANAVRPLALVATEDGGQSEVAFLSVLWNWTPYPRLLLFPPGDAGLDEDGSPSSVVREMGTCAWRPTAWMATSEDAAADYYFGNVNAGIRLVATDRNPLRRDVPSGEERTVLRYEWDAMDGSSVAAVEFTGPGPGLGQVVGLLSSVRTNLGVFDIGHYLALP
jgi:hypothetical protein